MRKPVWDQADFTGADQQQQYQQQGEFTLPEGMDMPSIEDPAQFAQLLLSDELIDHIVQQTNLYAKQQREGAEQKPFARRWTDVTAKDIRKVIAINLYFGLVQIGDTNLYWSEKRIYRNSFVSSLMGRQRFEHIMRYLHLNDSSTAKERGQPGYDPLHKVRPVLDSLMAKFRQLYKPGACLTVDEAMIKYKGRLFWKVYNPNKPIKRGIKVYCINEAGTGVCLGGFIYCGSHDPDWTGVADEDDPQPMQQDTGSLTPRAETSRQQQQHSRQDSNPAEPAATRQAPTRSATSARRQLFDSTSSNGNDGSSSGSSSSNRVQYRWETTDKVPQLGKTGDTVMRLCWPYFGSYRTVVMDNYYSTPSTFIHLALNGMWAIGTTRTDAALFPSHLLNKKGNRGDIDWLHTKLAGIDLLCAVYIDNKAVPFISTKHGSADIVGAIAKQRWSKKDNMKITLMEPQIKQDYDKGKTGTDLQDQHRAYFESGFDTRKPWHRILWWLIDICIFNAWRYYKQQFPLQRPSTSIAANTQPITHREFIEAVILSLVGDSSDSNSPTGTLFTPAATLAAPRTISRLRLARLARPAAAAAASALDMLAMAAADAAMTNDADLQDSNPTDTTGLQTDMAGSCSSNSSGSRKKILHLPTKKVSSSSHRVHMQGKCALHACLEHAKEAAHKAGKVLRGRPYNMTDRSILCQDHCGTCGVYLHTGECWETWHNSSRFHEQHREYMLKRKVDPKLW